MACPSCVQQGVQMPGKLVLWFQQAIHQFTQTGFFACHGEQTHDAYPRWICQRLEYVLGLNVY